jgi:hypothetical protein
MKIGLSCTFLKKKMQLLRKDAPSDMATQMCALFLAYHLPLVNIQGCRLEGGE